MVVLTAVHVYKKNFAAQNTFSREFLKNLPEYNNIIGVYSD